MLPIYGFSENKKRNEKKDTFRGTNEVGPPGSGS